MSGFVQLPATPLAAAFAIAVGLLIVASLISLVRAARGPRQGDRLAALALTMMNAVAVLALVAVARSDWRFLDVALVVAVLFGALPIAVARLARRGVSVRAVSEE